MYTSGALVFVMSVARITVIRLKETPKYLLGEGKDGATRPGFSDSGSKIQSPMFNHSGKARCLWSGTIYSWKDQALYWRADGSLPGIVRYKTDWYLYHPDLVELDLNRMPPFPSSKSHP